MPTTANEDALLRTENNLEYEHQRLVRVPGESSKFAKWSLVGLILNRSIGSGIFLTPHLVLSGTGCVGGALLVWTIASLASLCGLYVWLECGLSMPQYIVNNENEPRGVPRSGGEKNFLEFLYPNKSLRLPHLRTTCSFAFVYILLYNLGGNAIAFALQAIKASGTYDVGEEPRGLVLGIAIVTLTGIILLHTISRTGGIYVNNAFALVKVGLLLAIFALGVAKAAGAFGGAGDVPRNNFTRDVWTTSRSDVSSLSNAMLLAAFALSGWKQPFYMLTETSSPRKHLPKYTIIAWAIVVSLFMMVNVAYLLVVDKAAILPQIPGELPPGIDMAILFFDRIFTDNREQAERAMAGLVAFSIFGNLWVTTFTASRIKQEIAKEGILPKSLYLAATYTTPYGMLQKRWYRGSSKNVEIDRAPTAAFSLHYLSSIFIVAVTAPLADPRKAYLVLTSLYSYAINTLVGFAVAAGLLRIKCLRSSWHWQDRRRFRPWLSPVHAIAYVLFTAFILVAAFVPPDPDSPFNQSSTGIPYFIVPLLGITGPLWGVLWFWGLQIYEWRAEEQLTISREPYIIPDPTNADEYIQQGEIIDITWPKTSRNGRSDGFEAVKHGSDASSLLQRGGVNDRNIELGRLEGGRGFGNAQRDLVEDDRRLPDGFRS